MIIFCIYLSIKLSNICSKKLFLTCYIMSIPYLIMCYNYTNSFVISFICILQLTPHNHLISRLYI